VRRPIPILRALVGADVRRLSTKTINSKAQISRLVTSPPTIPPR
jgi:hypothetical protein